MLFNSQEDEPVIEDVKEEDDHDDDADDSDDDDDDKEDGGQGLDIVSPFSFPFSTV